MSWRVVAAAVFTVLPIALLLRYFYVRDVHREPRAMLLKTFLLGIASILPGYPLILLADHLGPSSAGPWVAAAYTAFVVAALPEELLKLVVIRGYSARKRSFDEPMDGVVYGATAALGFAALENVLYVMEGGLGTALLRAVTAVPMHAAAGAMIGYFVAQSVLLGGGRRALWKGFALAVTVHGLYDFGLMSALSLWVDRAVRDVPSESWIPALLALPVVVLIGSSIWTVRAVRRLRQGQIDADASKMPIQSSEKGPDASPQREEDSPESTHPTFI